METGEGEQLEEELVRRTNRYEFCPEGKWGSSKVPEETYSVRVFQRKVTSRRCAVSLRERTKGPATPPHIPTTWEGVAEAKLGET